MKKKINFEEELRNLYRKEADNFRMPDENDITAIGNAKALKYTVKKTTKPFRYGSLIASAAVIVLLLVAMPFLHLPNNDPYFSGDFKDSIQNNDSSTDNTNTQSTIPSNSVPGNTGNDEKKYPDLTTLSLSQWLGSDDVVWMNGSPTKGNISSGKIIEPGQVLIDDKLRNSFDSNNMDTIYAVMVDFTSMLNDNFVFEGKTISELSAEKDSLIDLGKMGDAKLIAQKISQAKEAYYFSMLEKFEEKFASMGLGIYHEERGCTIDNCIFYTFATQSQLEEFECTSTQAFIFYAAVRFK